MAPRGRFRSLLGGFLSVFAVTAYGCSSKSTLPPTGPQRPVATTIITGPEQPVEVPVDAGFTLVPASFANLRGWESSNFISARSAFLESCGRWAGKSDDTPISNRSPYGGVVGDWMPVCEALGNETDPLNLKPLFETLFTPLSIVPDIQESRLTGYFEPELDVKYTPEPGFTKSVPGIPADLVYAEPKRFESDYPKGKIWGRVIGDELEFYPDRADIIDPPEKALGYASAGKVFYLQIQGSGRLKFPDGRVLRAAFAAHNHKPFVSIAQHLIDTGEIERHQAGMNSILNWMERVGPERAQKAMNVNPRYVWFTPQEIIDPTKGPNGAQGVPLTPMASMAIDPRYHPYGTPIFLDTTAPKHAGDWQGAPFQNIVIAQDTGGAIKGILRGDLFFGWGDEAGGRAASMNHDVAMWVLLPKAIASDLTATHLEAVGDNG